MYFIIRKAEGKDKGLVIQAVGSLITELRNAKERVLIHGIGETYDYLMDHEEDGAIFIAEEESGVILGIIGIGISYALHCGKYGVIEEFWVCEEGRNHGVGKKLLQEAESFCIQQGIKRIDVGLPNEDFVNYENTYQCYTKNKYVDIGIRKKKVL